MRFGELSKIVEIHQILTLFYQFLCARTLFIYHGITRPEIKLNFYKLIPNGQERPSQPTPTFKVSRAKEIT